MEKCTESPLHKALLLIRFFWECTDCQWWDKTNSTRITLFPACAAHSFERWWLNLLPVCLRDIQRCVMKSLEPFFVLCHFSVGADQARLTMSHFITGHTACWTKKRLYHQVWGTFHIAQPAKKYFQTTREKITATYSNSVLENNVDKTSQICGFYATKWKMNQQNEWKSCFYLHVNAVWWMWDTEITQSAAYDQHLKLIIHEASVCP